MAYSRESRWAKIANESLLWTHAHESILKLHLNIWELHYTGRWCPDSFRIQHIQAHSLKESKDRKMPYDDLPLRKN